MSTDPAHTPGNSLRLVTPQESHGAHVENYDIEDLLTEPSKGLPEVDSSPEAIEARRTLAVDFLNEQAENILEESRQRQETNQPSEHALEESNPGQENTIEQEKAQWQDIIDVFTEQNEVAFYERLEELGYKTDRIQLDLFAGTLLRGHPPIDIETVGPYAAEHIDLETGELKVDISNIPAEEMSGLLTGAMFKRLIRHVGGSARIVSLLDEENVYPHIQEKTGRESFSSEEKDAYIEAMAGFLHEVGIIDDEDIMGSDVLLLRESELARSIPDLIGGLRDAIQARPEDSDRGSVEVRDGNIVFIPPEDIIENSGFSKNRRREFRKSGILLVKGQEGWKDEDKILADGNPSCQAMDAAGFLGDENKDLMHFIMIDSSMESQQNKVFAMLKMLGISGHDDFHNIFTDSDKLTPEQSTYITAQLLTREIKKLSQRDILEETIPIDDKTALRKPQRENL